MRHSAANTVSELSEYLSVTSSTVYRWINEGKLQAEKHDGILHIPIDQPNSSFIVKKIREKYSSPRLQVPKNIRGYHKWHTILDEICWLIKVTYSSRENVKRKRFRLDKILQNYLTIHEISLSKTKRIFQSGHTADIGDVSEDLRRAWYNELSYSLPLKTSTLGLSFSDISVNELSTIDDSVGFFV